MSTRKEAHAIQAPERRWERQWAISQLQAERKWRAIKQYSLTDDDVAFLTLLATGRKMDDIAVSFSVLYDYAQKWACKLYRKFGVHSREECLRKARRAGILPPKERE